MNRRQSKGILYHRQKLGFIFCKTASGSPKSESRTDDHRISDLAGRFYRLLHCVGYQGRKHRLSQSFTQFLKKLSVFRRLNAPAAGSQKLCPALL